MIKLTNTVNKKPGIGDPLQLIKPAAEVSGIHQTTALASHFFLNALRTQSSTQYTRQPALRAIPRFYCFFYYPDRGLIKKGQTHCAVCV